MTTAWVDCTAGVSGDMLLGALHDLGALAGLDDVLGSLGVGVAIEAARTTRGALAATQVTLRAPEQTADRRLPDVLALVDRAAADAAVRDRAAAVFRRLAAAEAHVHGVGVDDVHFHEVGALDAVADVLGACFGLHALGADAVVASPIALGGGVASSGHGALPVPGPAVLALLAGSDLVGTGGGDVELATPTGVAVLAAWATSAGAMPPMRVDRVGVGAGTRDTPDRPNVVRIVVGTAAVDAADDWVVVAANVDDLDPRLWPHVLDRLLSAGAADAWLTPILMKKGRPAHTVSALAPAAALDAVHRVLFTETSTIGLRATPVGKRALDRHWRDVAVGGHRVRVKVATLDGEVVNAAPEYDDVLLAARALNRPVKDVLAEAAAAARTGRHPAAT